MEQADVDYFSELAHIHLKKIKKSLHLYLLIEDGVVCQIQSLGVASCTHSLIAQCWKYTYFQTIIQRNIMEKNCIAD